MHYFHKRTEKSVDCKLDEPIPLSYYSSLAIGEHNYHPKTIRHLIQLKTKEYASGLGDELTEKKVMDFVSSFTENLISLADTQSATLDQRLESMLIPIDPINREVDNMTISELNTAFDELTRPMTLSEQQAAGNIEIPTDFGLAFGLPRGGRYGSSRYGGGDDRREETVEDLLSGARTQEEPSETGSGEGISFNARGERAMLRDVERSRTYSNDNNN